MPRFRGQAFQWCLCLRHATWSNTRTKSSDSHCKFPSICGYNQDRIEHHSWELIRFIAIQHINIYYGGHQRALEVQDGCHQTSYFSCCRTQMKIHRLRLRFLELSNTMDLMPTTTISGPIWWEPKYRRCHSDLYHFFYIISLLLYYNCIFTTFSMNRDL